MTVKPTIVYTFSLTDVPGVVAANTFASFFNPVGSGKVFAALQVLVQPYATGSTSVASSLALHRITAASGGTAIAASSVNRFDPVHPDPVVQVRTDNPTVTTSGLFVGSTAPAVTAGLGNNAPLSIQSAPGVALISYPGTGIAFRTQSGDVDQRWNVSLFWTELP